MFNRFIKSISFTAILIASFSLISIAKAQVVDEIQVNFNPNPLFGESNFLPGQTSQSSISIQNNSQTNRSVALEAINVSDSDNFGDTLQLRIEDSNQVYFNNTLADFFDQGLVNLNVLSAGNSADYNLTVNFISSTGNDYQNKTLGFDIQLFFTSEDDEGGEPITIASGGGDGSGGGGSGITTLTIFNELASNQTTNSAMISWFTNHPATSRVIYSPELGVHTFNFGLDANYGYVHSTSEDSTLVTFREIYLAGLEPDTLYYYRVISHRSNEADTVSPEHSFRTAGVLGLKEGEITSTDETGSFLPPALVKGIKEFFDSVQAQESESGEQVDQVDDLSGDADGQFEPIYDSYCENIGIWFKLFLVFVYILALGLNYFSKRRRKTALWFALLLIVAFLIVFILCATYTSTMFYLLGALFIFNLWAYLSNFNLRYHKWPVVIGLTLYFIIIFWTAWHCFC